MNSRKLSGTVRNSRELSGTVGNSREQSGTVGNSREQSKTCSNCQELSGAVGNCWVLSMISDKCQELLEHFPVAWRLNNFQSCFIMYLHSVQISQTIYFLFQFELPVIEHLHAVKFIFWFEKLWFIA